MRLDDAERQHLLALATRAPLEPIETVEHAPDALVRLITSMEPAPAYVLGPRWEFLAWNRAQSLLYPMIDRLADDDRNLLWVMFAEPNARRLLRRLGRPGPPDHGRVPLRHRGAAQRLHSSSTWSTGCIAASSEFAEWWPQLDVAQFQTRLRRYVHPRAGELVFEYQQLTPSEWPGLRVVCQLPVPGDDSAARLAAWRNIA